MTSKAATANPKDLQGIKKPPLSLIPSVALVHCAMAMSDGDSKYNAYNWRDCAVQARIYVDAALRHLLQWLEREETAGDSGIHHLGHAMACCAILLDAQHNNSLVDDRPENNPSLQELYDSMKPLLERHAQRKLERLMKEADIPEPPMRSNPNKVLDDTRDVPLQGGVVYTNDKIAAAGTAKLDALMEKPSFVVGDLHKAAKGPNPSFKK